MFFVGVDAHQKSCHLTVVDDSGAIRGRIRTASTRVALQSALARFEGPKRAVLEAGWGWGPIYDWLDEACDDVALAHPRKVRLIAEARVKTDRIDSEALARLLRADLVPTAYAPSAEERALKRLLRQRMFCVRLQTMLKNRIHALLGQHSVTKPALSDLFGSAGMAWLRTLRLPQPDGAILVRDLELLGQIREHIGGSDKLIAHLAAGDEAISWLRSLPGIGAFFSVLIRWEVVDIGRFASPKKLASYAGLVPSTYASGERVVHGRLTKEGNRWLRWAFVEAVSPAIRRSLWLRGYYRRLRARRCAKDARVATARKLLGLAWTIWTERRCYEERCA